MFYLLVAQKPILSLKEVGFLNYWVLAGFIRTINYIVYLFIINQAARWKTRVSEERQLGIVESTLLAFIGTFTHKVSHLSLHEKVFGVHETRLKVVLFLFMLAFFLELQISIVLQVDFLMRQVVALLVVILYSLIIFHIQNAWILALKDFIPYFWGLYQDFGLIHRLILVLRII